MHIASRRAVALLLAVWTASSAQASASADSCARGDAWSLSMDAERALERGAWTEAARQYACAARASDDPVVAERATREAYDNLQLERAVESAKRWLELAPTSEVARRYLATSLLRLYDEDGAAVQFAELLKTSYADRARGFLVLHFRNETPRSSFALRQPGRVRRAGRPIDEDHRPTQLLWRSRKVEPAVVSKHDTMLMACGGALFPRRRFRSVCSGLLQSAAIGQIVQEGHELLDRDRKAPHDESVQPQPLRGQAVVGLCVAP